MRIKRNKRKTQQEAFNVWDVTTTACEIGIAVFIVAAILLYGGYN
jgi:hypothetical protein